MTAGPVVSENADLSRLELHVDDRLAGWLDLRPAGDSVVLAHTEVVDGHEGAGFGGVLVRAAIDAARADGTTVIPTCPFAAAYIDRHPELQDALAPWIARR